MNEREWLASTDPGALLDWLTSQYGDSAPRHGPRRPDVSPRKLRLFACAVCRAVWPLLTDERSRRAVEVAERVADGYGRDRGWQEALLAARVELPGPPDGFKGALACLCHPQLFDALGVAGAIQFERPEQALAQAALLREIVGNPFQPVTRGLGVCPNCRSEPCTCQNHWERDRERLGWLTPAAVALARAAYDERRPDGTLDPGRLAVLADALEEAGCCDAALLLHLRGRERCPGCMGHGYTLSKYGSPGVTCGTCGDASGQIALRGPHVRGCWALDLLLGKEHP